MMLCHQALPEHMSCSSGESFLLAPLCSLQISAHPAGTKPLLADFKLKVALLVNSAHDSRVTGKLQWASAYVKCSHT